MRQLVLNIPEQDYSVIINYIQSHYKNIEIEEDDYPEQTKEEIINDIKEAVQEMKLIKQGKLKSTPAKEFFNEL